MSINPSLVKQQLGKYILHIAVVMHWWWYAGGEVFS